ncbi:MAG TPA: glycosyltransferase family 39 protein [Xanthobacteraceae bacterium]|nr:glycosyltransferase family 39 protein [Xanthobacteraceae bacterium]
MSKIEPSGAGRNPFERLFDALTDPARCERTMAFMLAGYAAVWTLYAVVAKGSQDIHFDMGEMVAWSREVTLGTPKHPPIAAWLVRAWFDVMPAVPWAYYLFAMAMATIALWIAWRVAARYLSPDKRLLGIALLTVVPFYNFHALKFNANTVLMPLWAATTWWFLRSLETRRAGWAVIAGLGAAAAMLGKYWSIFLIGGLGLAALTDPRRGSYFRSPAPWLTIAAGAAMIAPHLVWVANHDFGPFRYAFGAHPATYGVAALYAILFFGGIIAFVAAPMIINLIVTRPSMAAIGDSIWPLPGERRTAIVALVSPIFLAAFGSILLKMRIGALWTMSGMTLLPVALLSSPLVTVPRKAATAVLALAIAYPIVMLAASPMIAMVIHHEGVPNYAAHYQLIARAIERAWRARAAKPLRIVGSYSTLVNGVVFYFEEQPATLDIMTPAQTPWVDDDAIKRDGAVIVCPMPETYCIDAMNKYGARFANAEIEDVSLARRFFGALDKPVQYRIMVIPPGS